MRESGCSTNARVSPASLRSVALSRGRCENGKVISCIVMCINKKRGVRVGMVLM